MRPLATDRERELLGNGKRALIDCLAKVRTGEYQESLRALLIGVDALANLDARVSGQVTTEKQAEKDNRRRFVAFLRDEIPEWTEHEMQWEGKTIQLDLSELSYAIRCKQLHEYSDLTSPDYPIRLKWDQPLYHKPLMWIHGRPQSKVVDHVEINGLKLLQRLVEVAQKHVGIFSSTLTRGGARINPWVVYELLGTIGTGKPLNRFGFHSDDPDAVW